MTERVGAWLRRAREAKGNTLEEVEDAIHIRPRFLQALEAGDFAALAGGEAQIRGFLRIYARYLGLPPADVLARYDAEMRGGGGETSVPPAARPAATKTPNIQSPPPSSNDPFLAPRPSLLPHWPILLVGTLIILSVVVVGWYLFYGRSAESETPTSASGVSQFPTVTSMPLSAASSSSPSPDVSVATPTFPVSPDGRVTLTLAATEHVWTSVSADGENVFTGMMATNESKSWSGEQMVTVKTGNGAGLVVTVNDQAQGAMCGRGEVCTRSWRAEGEVSPP
ncbi:MAG TPA: helix-turn-helix domain-containing protein [Chloroflexi bacterium]|nr:helix-turn-helix domain-containing protein [Chloroflexota bacterium]